MQPRLSGGNPPRAALRIAGSLVSSALQQFISRDRAMAMVRVGDGEIAVISQYCHNDKEAIDPELQRAVDFCQAKSIPLIIGADSNAWSPL